MGVQRQRKQEYMARMQGRYLRATKREKGALLDEVVAVTGYHRRHAVRVLRHGRFPDPRLAAVQGLAPPGAAGRRPASAAGGHPGGRGCTRRWWWGRCATAAEASNWLCGTRLAPFLPELVPALEAEGELRLDARGPGAAAGDERAHDRPAAAPLPAAARPAELARAGHDQARELASRQVCRTVGGSRSRRSRVSTSSFRRFGSAGGQQRQGHLLGSASWSSSLAIDSALK